MCTNISTLALYNVYGHNSNEPEAADFRKTAQIFDVSEADMEVEWRILSQEIEIVLFTVEVDKSCYCKKLFCTICIAGLYSTSLPGIGI